MIFMRYSMAMNTDIISATLTKMRLKAVQSSVIDAGDKWSLKFPTHGGVKFYTLLKGECWLAVEGEKKTYHLLAGDCILLPRGRSFVLTSNLALKKHTPIEVAVKGRKNGVMTCDGGGNFLLLGVAFQFEGFLPEVIFGRLPLVIYVSGSSDQSVALRWNLDRYAAEFHGQQIGRSLMLNQLAPVIFLQILRVYLASEKHLSNWFVALSDPKLFKAIQSIHNDCGRRWTLNSLAQVAGMSRSTFAINFKSQVGLAPIDYLTRWRMLTACEFLEAGNKSMTEIANSVGYDSESAFSVAFNRVVKCRPGFYQKNFESLRKTNQAE